MMSPGGRGPDCVVFVSIVMSLCLVVSTIVPIAVGGEKMGSNATCFSTYIFNHEAGIDS